MALQGSQLKNCRYYLSLGVRKPFFSQTAPTSPQVVWEGFKQNPPHSSKNKLQYIQLSYTT